MTFWDKVTYPFRRQPYSALSQRRPDQHGTDVPLGMEAVDMSQVNAINRRNEALERSSRLFGNTSAAQFQNAVTQPKPMPEDETYAAAYHRAFQKKDT